MKPIRTIIKTITASSLLLSLTACDNKETVGDAVEVPAAAESQTGLSGDEVVLDTLNKKYSYIIGHNTVKGLDAPEDFDFGSFELAYKDVISGKESRLSDEEAQAVIIEVQGIALAKRQAAFAIIEQKNKDAAAAYLAKNREKEGVITTNSGLQYRIIYPGSGTTPKPDDRVSIYYKGKSIDGREIENNTTHQRPTSLAVGGTMPGLSEGLTYMKVGGVYEFVIPANLAHGENGGRHGPHAILIYEVNLVEIL